MDSLAKRLISFITADKDRESCSLLWRAIDTLGQQSTFGAGNKVVEMGQMLGQSKSAQ